MGASSSKHEAVAMRQYEIWWAALNEPIGRRPVLLLSRDAAYAFLSNVLIAEITTTVRRIPQEMALGRRDGLPTKCVVNFDNLHSIQKSALASRIGELSRARIGDVKRAVGSALGWPELVLQSRD